jgi:hypothetical protein
MAGRPFFPSRELAVNGPSALIRADCVDVSAVVRRWAEGIFVAHPNVGVMQASVKVGHVAHECTRAFGRVMTRLRIVKG